MDAAEAGDFLVGIAFPEQPKPREATAWVDNITSNPESIGQRLDAMRITASPAAEQAKLKLRQYIGETIIPTLQSGSERVKMRPGREDEFLPCCDLAKQFFEALGGLEHDEKQQVAAGTPKEAAEEIRKLLAKAAPIDFDEAARAQERLHKLLVAGGLIKGPQVAEVAEQVIERLHAHVSTLKAGVEDADALGDDPGVYQRASDDAAELLAQVQQQLAADAWRPLKLSDSVESEHGSLIRSVDKLYDEFADEMKTLKLKFPEVIVVGSESVGKSSLLEKVAGMDFFPRGENVTTRLGFRLRLHHCSPREMVTRKQEAKGAASVDIAGKEVMMRFEDEREYLASVERARARVSEENAKVQKARQGVVGECRGMI